MTIVLLFINFLLAELKSDYLDLDNRTTNNLKRESTLPQPSYEIDYNAMTDSNVVVSNPLENNNVPTNEIENVIATSNAKDLANNELTVQDNIPITSYNEKVCTTLGRSLGSIWAKIKFAVIPLVKNTERSIEVLQWDLYGPLFFVLLLYGTLYYAPQPTLGLIPRVNPIYLVSIFFFGCFIIWLNAALMDSKISLFQTFSIFGYSMYPLNIVALVLSILMNWYMVKEWFRIALIVLAISWCTFNLNGFIFRFQLVRFHEDNKNHQRLSSFIVVSRFFSNNFIVFSKNKSKQMRPN